MGCVMSNKPNSRVDLIDKVVSIYESGFLIVTYSHYLTQQEAFEDAMNAAKHHEFPLYVSLTASEHITLGHEGP